MEIPDFESDTKLSEKQKQRRRYYWRTRETALLDSSRWAKSNRGRVKVNRDKPENKIKHAARNKDWHGRKMQTDPAYKEKRRLMSLEYYRENRERQLASCKAAGQRLKLEAINAYGGHCTCCGEETLEFLALDHIHNDGHKESCSGQTFYRKLRRQEWPQGDLQVLCHNCNSAFAFFGYCPHEKTKAILFSTSFTTRPIQRIVKMKIS